MVHAPEGRLVFRPMGRKVCGATGLIDLHVLPSYDPLILVRHEDGGWKVHPLGRLDIAKDWDEGSFSETARDLFASA